MNERARESFVPPLWLFTVVAVFLFFWLVVALKEIVVLLVVGYAIAYLIDPVLEWLERRKISRTIGFFCVCGVLAFVVLMTALFVIPTFLDEYEKLSTNFPQYVDIAQKKFSGLFESARHLFPKALPVKDGDAQLPGGLVPNLDSDTLHGILEGLFGFLLKGYSITLTILNLTLLPFIVFYISVDFEKIHRAFLAFIPYKYQSTVTSLATQIDNYVSAFVRGQLVVGLILFTLYTLGLGIIGVDFWFLLAAITGFGNLVPYLGFLTGLILSSIMALVTFGDFTHLYQVWGVYAVVQTAEGTFITPKIVGKSVGLSPLVIILALFAGGKILGLLGLFLAVPLAATIRVVGRYAHHQLVSRV